MADLVDVALSVSTTLVLQGAYFVLLDYPQKLAEEHFGLQVEWRKQVEHSATQQDALQVLQRSSEAMETFQQKLSARQDSSTVNGMRIVLGVALAELRGLEVADEPLASNVRKQADVLTRAGELAAAWSGEPDTAALDELKYRAITLLHSAQAVKRADDQYLQAFWMEMSKRSAALRGLIRKYTASALGLEAAGLVLLGTWLHELHKGRLLSGPWAWLLWTGGLVFALGAHRRVLRRVRPNSVFAGFVEQKVKENLKSLEVEGAEISGSASPHVPAAGAASSTD